MRDQKVPINQGFGERLQQLFEGLSVGDIAIKLKVSYYGARNYLLGRVPSWNKLVEISDLTNCNIHWLLTGKGPKTVADIKSINIQYPAVLNEDIDSEEVRTLIVEKYLIDQLLSLASKRKSNIEEMTHNQKKARSKSNG